MSKFTSFANDVLDAVLNNASSGTVVLGSTTYTLPFKLRLTTTVSTASTPGTEVSGGSYADQSIAGAFTTGASAAAKASTGALTYSNMPAGTWADAHLIDSTGTPKPLIFRGGSSLAKTVNAGDTCLVPAGSLSGTEG
jgi:hypothetical protein